jgi:hypothetical protein
MMYKPKEEKGQKRGIERKWAEAKAESVRRGQEKNKGPQSGPFFFFFLDISAPVDETRPLKHP